MAAPSVSPHRDRLVGPPVALSFEMGRGGLRHVQGIGAGDSRPEPSDSPVSCTSGTIRQLDVRPLPRPPALGNWKRDHTPTVRDPSCPAKALPQRHRVPYLPFGCAVRCARATRTP